MKKYKIDQKKRDDIKFVLENMDLVRSIPILYVEYLTCVKNMLIEIHEYTPRLDQIYTRIFDKNVNLSELELAFDQYIIELKKNNVQF